MCVHLLFIVTVLLNSKLVSYLAIFVSSCRQKRQIKLPAKYKCFFSSTCILDEQGLKILVLIAETISAGVLGKAFSSVQSRRSHVLLAHTQYGSIDRRRPNPDILPHLMLRVHALRITL